MRLKTGQGHVQRGDEADSRVMILSPSTRRRSECRPPAISPATRPTPTTDIGPFGLALAVAEGGLDDPDHLLRAR